MKIERRLRVALRWTVIYSFLMVLVLGAAFAFGASAATLGYGEFVGEYRGNPSQLGNDGVGQGLSQPPPRTIRNGSRIVIDATVEQIGAIAVPPDQGVVATATKDLVVADPTLEMVVTAIALEDVVTAVAADLIVTVTAGDVLDRDQIFENRGDAGHLVEHLFRGIADAGIEAFEVDDDRHRDIGEVGSVIAVAAMAEVGIDACLERIVAGTAEQPVLARSTNQEIVARAAPQKIVTRATGQLVAIISTGKLIVALAAKH